MATLSDARIAALLEPYLGSASLRPDIYAQLSAYLDLLLRWNARTNLTAIREPEEIVRRLLDFGSGAGFPGLPIQLLHPSLRVTLAESQGKKASFLREAIRTLNLPTEVWAARVDTMPPIRRFNAVTLRAVDNMQQALANARPRVAPGGWLVTLSTEPAPNDECIALPGKAPGWLTLQALP
jgi:16S rRNA (guanine527-N7)-methyltransferase